MRRLIAPLVILALASACANLAADDSVSDQDPPGGGGRADAVLTIQDGVADGPGISVSQAIANGGAEPLFVNGALFVSEDGTVRLCEAIAESFPPQCGGQRVVVEGLDLADIPDLQEANGVRWAESVQLLGTVAAGS